MVLKKVNMDTTSQSLEWLLLKKKGRREGRKEGKVQVWTRMWRNWNICTLLIGTQNGTDAMENSRAIAQKMKSSITI